MPDASGNTTPVVVVAGAHRAARRAVVEELLTVRGSVALHHDLRALRDGIVRWVVRDVWGVRHVAHLPVSHGCVACAVGETIVPSLAGMALDGEHGLYVLETDDAVEPRQVAEAVEVAPVRVCAVVTAVDARRLLADLGRAVVLPGSEIEPGAGDQLLAEVLAHQVEYASDVVLVPGEPAVRAGALVRQLNPAAAVHRPDAGTVRALASRSFDTESAAARVDPWTLRLPNAQLTGGISTVSWRRRAPLHPGRFYDTIDRLVRMPLRGRGRFWLANRPDLLLSWDAAGGRLTIEQSGLWLAATPERDWPAAPPPRRAAAAVDWDPDCGDRIQHLCFTGPDLRSGEIEPLLDACLLTDHERHAGAGTLTDDPFTDYLDPSS